MHSSREAEEYLDRLEENVPQRLIEEALWAPYRLVHMEDRPKPAKIPVNPFTFDYASTADPKTWGTYDEARDAFLDGIEDGEDFTGLGMLLTPELGVFGIDLDACRNPATADIELREMDIIRRMDSYAEVSQSGTGVHLLGNGRIPDGWRIKEFEVYDHLRFFTMTGELLDDVSTDLEDRQEELEALFRDYGERIERKPDRTSARQHTANQARSPVSITDEELLARLYRSRHAARVRQLVEEGLVEGDDHSDSEFELAFYVLGMNGGDEEQADRIIRNSKLDRSKWDESRGDSTYGAQTIRKAAEAVQESDPFASGFQFTDATPLDLSDNGNGHLLSQHLYKKVAWDPDSRCWRHFDGAHWKVVGQGKVLELARQVLEDRAHALLDTGTYQNEKALKFAVNSLAANRIRSAVELLKTMPLIIRGADTFDAEPNVINVQNGTLRFVKNDNGVYELQFDDHNRNDRITFLAPMKYEPTADDELFQKVLDQAFGEDRELAEYFQTCVGYSILGSAEQELAFFCHGPGGSSKGTLLEPILHAFEGYATPMSFDSLRKRKDSGGPRSDLVRLEPFRMVVASEANRGERIDAALFKLLTGRDTTALRDMYRREGVFKPHFTIWLMANDLPVLPHDDTGLWRRIKVIPFDHPIPEKDQDPLIKAKLCDAAKSGPGILNWVVEGALRYLNLRETYKRIPTPAAVELATEDYRFSTDSVRLFIRDCCKEKRGGFTSTSTLYDAYRKYVDGASGLQALSQTAFVQRLEGMGHERTRHRGKRGIRGVSMVHRGMGQ